MPNGNEWYGGRLPGWDWWRQWQEREPGRRYQQPMGLTIPYGAGRYGPPSRQALGPEWQRMAMRRPQGQPGMAPTPTGLVPGQYTPSQGFGMIPYQGIQGPGGGARATPGAIPAQEGWIRSAIGLTPVEAALARIGEMAAGQQPAEPERPEAQFPGYWEAIGQQPGNYPVPQGAVQGMWGPRRPWEEWSWRTRGTPLQGHEILRVEGGRMPWGGQRREPNLDPQGRRIGYLSIRGGGGREELRKKRQQGTWQPGAWGGTF